MKVLWLSPMLNHYKARFLNRLHNEYPLELTVMAGTGRTGKGDFQWAEETSFNLVQVPVSKSDFGLASEVRSELKAVFAEFDWVMIPKEHKNLPLFMYALWLQKRFSKNDKKTKLFSYNHPIVTEGPKKAGFFSRMIDRYFYQNLDKVVFYTEESYKKMVRMSYIDSAKGTFANNTLDTAEIDRHYEFKYPNPEEPTILFIGRLIPAKRLSVLFDYFNALKKRPGLNQLKLVLIGDGPESSVVKNAAEQDESIEWVGTITDESKIAPFMAKASIVFIPGHTGLSVNHALCYGRPMVTLGGIHQPPEIDYLQSGKNGVILLGTKEENIDQIAGLLVNFDRELYDRCYETGKLLSVDNWCHHMYKALQ